MENSFNKKIKFRKDGHAFGWGSSPDNDWKIIFLTTLFLVVLITAWDAFTYFKMKMDDPFNSEFGVEDVEPIFSQENLRSTVEYYKDKAEELERIRKGSSEATSVIDPSI